jgi:histidyl-tRNA synthetase
MGRKPKIQNDWLHTPKGTRDILGDDYLYQKEVYSRAEHIASFYGFLPIQTPHIEKEQLFTATLGETSDIVEKQMYAIKTRGGDRLVLRPEGTSPIMRAYLEHGMHTLPQPIMFWYEGSFFRHENPQRGRFREFGQFGLEILGESDAFADALVIVVLFSILKEIGIKNAIVHVNTLGDKECASLYRKDLTAYLRKKVNYLCKDCGRRLKTNPLRILDCKEEKCKEIKQNAPQMINYMCGSCRDHFKNLLETLDAAKVPYLLNHYLVRGLDYYSRTVFEIFFGKEEENGNEAEEKDAFQESSKDDSEEFQKSHLAVGGGGRYDYLSSILSKREVPAVGGSLGIDRIIKFLKEEKIKFKTLKAPKIFLIQLGLIAKRKSLNLIEEFRKANIPLAQSLVKDSMKSQLRAASKMEVPFSLILGQKEALDGTIIVRDMNLGSQEIISFSEIIDYIKKRI